MDPKRLKLYDEIKKRGLTAERDQKILSELYDEGTHDLPDALPDNTARRPLTEILDRYFRGESISGDIPLDWSGSTKFSVTVWRTTQSIPWGEVRTYKWLSHCLERPRSFRAVGVVLGKNPFPIVVPCHRVVRSDGGLGGFSAPTGTQLKRKMLEMEGVRFDRNGRVVF